MPRLSRPASIAEFVQHLDARIVLISAPEFGFDPRATEASETYRAPVMAVTELLQHHFKARRTIAYRDLGELGIMTALGEKDVEQQLKQLTNNAVFDKRTLETTVDTGYAQRFTSAVDFAGSTSGTFCASRIHHVAGTETIYGTDDFDRDVSNSAEFAGCKMTELEKRKAAIAHSFWVCFWRGATQSALKSTLISMPDDRPTGPYTAHSNWIPVNGVVGGRLVIAVSIDGGPVTQAEKAMIPEICDSVVADLQRRSYAWASRAQVVWCCFPSVLSFLRSLDGEQRLTPNTDVEMRSPAWIDKTQDEDPAPQAEGVLQTSVDDIEKQGVQGVEPIMENLLAAIELGDSNTATVLLEKAPHLANGEKVPHTMMMAKVNEELVATVLKYIDKKDLKERFACLAGEDQRATEHSLSPVHFACLAGNANALRLIFSYLNPPDVVDLIKQPTAELKYSRKYHAAIGENHSALDLAIRNKHAMVLDVILEHLGKDVAMSLLSATHEVKEKGDLSTYPYSDQVTCNVSAFQLALRSGSVEIASSITKCVGSSGLASLLGLRSGSVKTGLSSIRKCVGCSGLASFLGGVQEDDEQVLLTLALRSSTNLAMFLIDNLNPKDRLSALTSGATSDWCFLDELYDNWYDRQRGRRVVLGDAEIAKRCFNYLQMDSLEVVDDTHAPAATCFGGSLLCGKGAAAKAVAPQAHLLQDILRRGLLETALWESEAGLEMKKLAVEAAEPGDLRRVLKNINSEGDSLIHRLIYKNYGLKDRENWTWLFARYDSEQLEALLSHKNAAGHTALHLACRRLDSGCLEAMRMSMGDSGWQKILVAEDAQCKKPVQVLVEVEVLVDRFGCACAHEECVDIIAQMLEVLTKNVSSDLLHQLVRTPFKSGSRLLHTVAARTDSLKLLSQCLDLYGDASARFAALETLDDKGRTVLFVRVADESEDLDMLRLILEHYDEDTLLATCQRRDVDDCDLLAAAVGWGKRETLPLLLSRLRCGDVEKLVPEGGEVDEKARLYDLSEIIAALRGGKRETLPLLLSRLRCGDMEKLVPEGGEVDEEASFYDPF